MLCFEIAEVTIGVRTLHKLKITYGFEPFIIHTYKYPDFVCAFQEKDFLPELSDEKIIGEDVCVRIYSDKTGKEIRVFYDREFDSDYYAVRTIDTESKIVSVEYLSGFQHFLNETQNAFFHIGLEEILMLNQGMILHASLLETEFGGIIFSGPSGIGKSTQSDLWAKHRNSTIINGDKTILRKKGNHWIGYGSPYAGSSAYYVNRGVQVKAIVLLQQGTGNDIAVMKEFEAFHSLYINTTINTWNEHFVNTICDLLQVLIKDIPVLLFSCSKDEEAVMTLENVIKEMK